MAPTTTTAAATTPPSAKSQQSQAQQQPKSQREVIDLLSSDDDDGGDDDANGTGSADADDVIVWSAPPSSQKQRRRRQQQQQQQQQRRRRSRGISGHEKCSAAASKRRRLTSAGSGGSSSSTSKPSGRNRPPKHRFQSTADNEVISISSSTDEESDDEVATVPAKPAAVAVSSSSSSSSPSSLPSVSRKKVRKDGEKCQAAATTKRSVPNSKRGVNRSRSSSDGSGTDGAGTKKAKGTDCIQAHSEKESEDDNSKEDGSTRATRKDLDRKEGRKKQGNLKDPPTTVTEEGGSESQSENPSEDDNSDGPKKQGNLKDPPTTKTEKDGSESKSENQSQDDNSDGPKKQGNLKDPPTTVTEKNGSKTKSENQSEDVNSDGESKHETVKEAGLKQGTEKLIQLKDPPTSETGNKGTGSPPTATAANGRDSPANDGGGSDFDGAAAAARYPRRRRAVPSRLIDDRNFLGTAADGGRKQGKADVRSNAKKEEGCTKENLRIKEEMLENSKRNRGKESDDDDDDHKEEEEEEDDVSSASSSSDGSSDSDAALDSSDDDDDFCDDDESTGRFSKRPKVASSRKKTTIETASGAARVQIKAESSDAGTRGTGSSRRGSDDRSDDDSDDDRKPAARPTVSTKHEIDGSDQDENGIEADVLFDDDDDDMAVVVDCPEAAAIQAAASAPAGHPQSEEDVQLVGTRNKLLLPHARFNCVEKPFNHQYPVLRRNGTCTHCPGDVIRLNSTTCGDLCYCYVCDTPSKDCKYWTKIGGKHRYPHCLATDKGPNAPYWKEQRQSMKDELKTRDKPRTEAMTSHATAASDTDSRFSIRSAISSLFSFSGGSSSLLSKSQSPFPPDHTEAQRNENVTKCRHCGWYSYFDHHNFAFFRRKERNGAVYNREPSVSLKEINPTGYLDWCHACGRVASDRDFAKVQSKPFLIPPGVSTEPKVEAISSDDENSSSERSLPPASSAPVPKASAIKLKTQEFVLLGTKRIAFRLKAHDPRSMEKYSSKWQNHEGQPGWIHNQKELELELFQHRFGPRPTLEMIYQSISPSSEADILKDGGYKDYPATSLYGAYYQTNEQRKMPKVSASETEAMIIDDDKDRLFLFHLYDVAPSFGKRGTPSKTPVDGDIRATWNRSSQKGEITVRLYINPSVKPGKMVGRVSMTQLLGSFYNIFPLDLKDLAGIVKMEHNPTAFERGMFYHTDKSERVRLHECETYHSEKRENLIREFNAAVDAVEGQLSLTPGIFSSDTPFYGGICTNETGLKGILKRMFRESLPDIANQHTSDAVSFFLESQNKENGHRSLRKSGQHALVTEHGYSSPNAKKIDVKSFLTKEQLAILVTDFAKPAEAILDGTKTIDDLMAHLENLGHSSAAVDEGIKVELLPFQKESLKWALERETIPGGIQSLFWAKLPFIEQPNIDIWFNPMLGQSSKCKPNLVRGGILAEQMGLGKTVISLALILQNPAPAFPSSGSKSSDVLKNPNTGSGEPFWDPDLNERICSTRPAKYGSIISRGTLVVCNVSLVGQWMDEAKSKLTDPGLVYPYHGSNRKRCPKILARNSIVVTTYETLAADDTYHRAKSSKPDTFVPPCAQVRWWRIICDESHVIRNANVGKATAVMDILADNRWLVSGTPINTTILDLKNQLKFLGLQNISDIFDVLKNTVFCHVRDPQGPNKRVKSRSRSKRWSMNNDSDKSSGIGYFTFLMRSIMLRHSQDMMYRGTKTKLMGLPPKEEKVVHVTFNEADSVEYKALEEDARNFYEALKAKKRSAVSKNYMKLTQKLTTLRAACAGGHAPLGFEAVNGDENEDENDDDGDGLNKVCGKREVKYSEFAYTSKLNKLIQELKAVRDNDPSSKSLVFSQFVSTLKWLQTELPKHGFQYRTLSGSMPMKQRAKALADFQHDPPTTIFLLSIRAGACGINLTQASNVFLMEPFLNPALKKQAIGRVYRLGQTRKVTITQLIMQNSIETRILKVLKMKRKSSSSNHSTSSGNDANEDSAHTEADKKEKDTKESVLPAQVGSLTKDKNQLVTEEFDFLFGSNACDVDSASDEKDVCDDEDDDHDDGDGSLEGDEGCKNSDDDSEKGEEDEEGEDDEDEDAVEEEDDINNFVMEEEEEI